MDNNFDVIDANRFSDEEIMGINHSYVDNDGDIVEKSVNEEPVVDAVSLNNDFNFDIGSTETINEEPPVVETTEDNLTTTVTPVDDFTNFGSIESEFKFDTSDIATSNVDETPAADIPTIAEDETTVEENPYFNEFSFEPTVEDNKTVEENLPVVEDTNSFNIDIKPVENKVEFDANDILSANSFGEVVTEEPKVELNSFDTITPVDSLNDYSTTEKEVVNNEFNYDLNDIKENVDEITVGSNEIDSTSVAEDFKNQVTIDNINNKFNEADADMAELNDLVLRAAELHVSDSKYLSGVFDNLKKVTKTYEMLKDSYGQVISNDKENTVESTETEYANMQF